MKHKLVQKWTGLKSVCIGHTRPTVSAQNVSGSGHTCVAVGSFVCHGGAKRSHQDYGHRNEPQAQTGETQTFPRTGEAQIPRAHGSKPRKVLEELKSLIF